MNHSYAAYLVPSAIVRIVFALLLDGRTCSCPPSTFLFLSVVAVGQDLLDVIESTKVLKEAQAKEDSPEARATLPMLSVRCSSVSRCTPVNDSQS